MDTYVRVLCVRLTSAISSETHFRFVGSHNKCVLCAAHNRVSARRRNDCLLTYAHIMNIISIRC